MCLIFHSTEDMVFEEDILVDEEIAVGEALLNDDLTAEDIWAFEKGMEDVRNGRTIKSTFLQNVLHQWVNSGESFNKEALRQKIFQR